jgi:hypothetical protein
MGINGNDEGASVRKVSGDSKTAARSLDFDSTSVCSKIQARNARASSRESAVTTKGFSLLPAAQSTP